MNIELEIEKYEKEIKALNISKGIKDGIGIDYIMVGGRVMYPIKAIARFQVLRQIKTA